MKSERGALILSVVMSLVVGAAAVTAASLTQSKAILLDGLFNLIYFLVALVTVRISVLAAQPDDRKFPFGYGYFESLVNAGKGLLILGVALFALVDAEGSAAEPYLRSAELLAGRDAPRKRGARRLSLMRRGGRRLQLFFNFKLV